MSKVITPRHEDPARWYTDVVIRAELADSQLFQDDVRLQQIGSELCVLDAAGKADLLHPGSRRALRAVDAHQGNSLMLQDRPERNDDIVDQEQLARRLEQTLQATERKIVVLRADTSTSHGEVVEIMDLIRSAGAQALTVAARAAAE